MGTGLLAAIHRDLVAYAEILARETDQPVSDPVRVVAPMLERCMTTDRGFAKARACHPAHHNAEWQNPER
jgi:hypothetical protein